MPSDSLITNRLVPTSPSLPVGHEEPRRETARQRPKRQRTTQEEEDARGDTEIATHKIDRLA